MDPRYGIKHGPTSVPVLVQVDPGGRKEKSAEAKQITALDIGHVALSPPNSKPLSKRSRSLAHPCQVPKANLPPAMGSVRLGPISEDCSIAQQGGVGTGEEGRGEGRRGEDLQHPILVGGRHPARKNWLRPRPCHKQGCRAPPFESGEIN